MSTYFTKKEIPLQKNTGGEEASIIAPNHEEFFCYSQILLHQFGTGLFPD